MDCGFDISSRTTRHFFANGKIFLVIIAIVVILGLIVIGITGDNSNSPETVDDAEDVKLTIKNVNGYDNGDSEKPLYTLYTEVLYSSAPDNMDDYEVKTTYYDSSDKEIGHKLASLTEEYSNSKYGTYIGEYSTYQLPNPDYVKIEIFKDKNLINEYRDNVDVSNIEFLN